MPPPTRPQAVDREGRPRLKIQYEARSGPMRVGRAAQPLQFAILMLQTVSIPWTELARRTWREVLDDDVLGLAAQLSCTTFS